MAKKRNRPRPARPLTQPKGPSRDQIDRALEGIGRGGDAAAVPVLRQLLALEPGHVTGAHGLGLALLHVGQAQEAETWLARALKARPEDPDIAFAWAFLHYLTDRPGRAADLLRTLLTRHPEYRRARAVLGDALRLAGHKEEALAALEALGEAPDIDALGTLLALRAEVCAWESFDADQARLVAGLEAQLNAGRAPSLQPFGAIKLGLPSTLVRRIAESRVIPAAATPPSPRKGPLRVGYLSADLYDHPVGILLAPILEAHGPDLEVRAYATRQIDDAVRGRIEAAVPVVGLEGLDDSAAATRIAADGLDLLVDTIGFTNSARTGLLARRPAARTVHWLGYPGSMPRRLVDAQITSRPRLGPAGAGDYDERLILLPETFIASEGFGAGPLVPSREALGLPPDSFVFGFFGSPYRLEPKVWAAWGQILDAVPEAVLWIQLDAKATRDRLRAALAHLGIDPKRLYFAAEGPLSRLWHHTRADLWLDAWRLSSGTASIVAMWTGTPLLTLAGSTPPARTGIGVLAAAGAEALVAETPAAYIERAIGLARDPEALRGLRASLIASRARSPLFDVPRFTRHLEDAFRAVRALEPRSVGAPIALPARPSSRSAA